MFVTSTVYSWSPLSRVSLLYWYYKNTVLRLCDIVWFLIILFESLYPFTLHQHTSMNNSTIFFVTAIVTGEFNILILRKYGFKVCAILFGFYLSCFKVYINSPCINTQRQTTAQFSLWSPLSRVSLLYWYYENTVLSFVWYHLVFIQLIFKFISIYPE